MPCRRSGRKGRSPISSITTRSRKAVTSPPGSSRSCSPKSCALASSRCASSSKHVNTSTKPAESCCGLLLSLIPTDKEQTMNAVVQQSHGDPTAILPFRVNVPESELTDLRRRIEATRWPEKETVADTSQGVPLVPLQ